MNARCGVNRNSWPTIAVRPLLFAASQHFGALRCVERERLLAQHVLARGERGERQRMMTGGRRGDRDRVEVVARDQLERIGVHVANPGVLCDLCRLVAVAAADRGDVPAFRAESGDVDLRSEPDTDDTDLALRSWHGNSIGTGADRRFGRETGSDYDARRSTLAKRKTAAAWAAVLSKLGERARLPVQPSCPGSRLPPPAGLIGVGPPTGAG